MKTIFTRMSRAIYYTIFSLSLMLIPGGLWAQITITSSDMPSAGDTVRKSTSVDLGTYDFSLTGENYNWDFSDLSSPVQAIDTFVSVSSVPFLYQFVFIPNLVANLAQKYNGLDTLGLPVTEPYRFFKNSSSSFTDVGYAVTISDIPVPLKFNNADVIYKFPMDYANVDSSFSGIDFGLPDIGFISIDRKRVNEVDGWGTLTTPYGSFEVLRLKSMVEETDSIYVDSLSFGTAIDRVYTEYKWMANGQIAPVLQVNVEAGVTTVVWIDSIYSLSTAITEPVATQSNLKISPNPISNKGRIELKLSDRSSAELLIFNASGMHVATLFDGQLQAGEHSFEVDVNDLHLTNGIYFIKGKTSSEIFCRKMIIHRN